jgi:uncharacterized RDD family membrane protein YckC
MEGGYMDAAAPVPTTGASKSGFWRRTFAYLIDAIALGIVLQILNGFLIGSALTSSDAGQIAAATTRAVSVNLIISIGYFVVLWTYWGGQTLGMKVLGIKVVKTDGSAVTLVTAILRYVGIIISTIPLFLGLIWVAFDANKQGWHDKIASTYVVRTA